MSTNTTYLITGANRGIGRGLTAELLQRPYVTVIAAVRDTSATTFVNLPAGDGSKLIIVKLDSLTESDAKEVVAQLLARHGITSLDVVIANAGIANSSASVDETTSDNLRDHFNTNTIGPVLLFQATKPLLKESDKPVFLAISSGVGSMGVQEAFAAFPAKFSPYGASKAALNWLVRRIHFEEPWLTAYVTHPGVVMTDMLNTVAGPGADPVALGAITVDASVKGMLSTLDSASREIGGTFQNHDGTTLPW
ncbi:hypothetical protein PMIN03_012679 [Paraphaeosphaeria minitans]